MAYNATNFYGVGALGDRVNQGANKQALANAANLNPLSGIPAMQKAASSSLSLAGQGFDLNQRMGSARSLRDLQYGAGYGNLGLNDMMSLNNYNQSLLNNQYTNSLNNLNLQKQQQLLSLLNSISGQYPGMLQALSGINLNIGGILGNNGQPIDKNIRQPDIQGLINSLQNQGKGYNSDQMRAAQSLGQNQINNQYRQGLQGLQSSLNSRGVSGGTGSSMRADALLNSLNSQRDLQNQLQGQSAGFSQNALSTLNNVLSGDISRQQGAQQNNAQLGLQGQQLASQNQQYGINFLQSLLQSLGAF